MGKTWRKNSEFNRDRRQNADDYQRIQDRQNRQNRQNDAIRFVDHQVTRIQLDIRSMSVVDLEVLQRLIQNRYEVTDIRVIDKQINSVA
jgi:hypothetical protein